MIDNAIQVQVIVNFVFSVHVSPIDEHENSHLHQLKGIICSLRWIKQIITGTFIFIHDLCIHVYVLVFYEKLTLSNSNTELYENCF